MLTDPTGDHVTEQTGEGVLLPGHVRITDALHDVFGDRIGDPGIFQGLAPARVAEAGTQRHNQLQGTGDTENDADPVAIKFLAGGVSGILQGLIDSDQPEQLRGIDRFERIGQHAIFHGIKIYRREETAVLGVDFIRRLGVGIEIVVGAPMGFRNLDDRVATALDVAPEGALIFSLGEKATDADNRQRRRCRGLLILFSAVFLQLRNSLICSISRGAESAASSSKHTP